MTVKLKRWWLVVATAAVSLVPASPVTAGFVFRLADPAVPGSFSDPFITVNNPTTTQLLGNGFSAMLDFTLGIPPGANGSFGVFVAIERDFTVTEAQQDRTRSAMSGTVTIVGTDTTISPFIGWLTVVNGEEESSFSSAPTQPVFVGPGTFPFVGETGFPNPSFRFSAPVGPATLRGGFVTRVELDPSAAIRTFRYHVEGTSTIEPTDPLVIPEPGTLSLLVAALLGAMLWRRDKSSDGRN